MSEKMWGSYTCNCGMRVSLAGFAQVSHERGKKHAAALSAAKLCRDCGQRPAGERDHQSPFCGRCDPNGARFFDEAKS